MNAVLLLLLLLAACKRPDPAPERSASNEEGPCRSVRFEGDLFTLCRDSEARLELHVAGADERPFRSFAVLDHVLGARAGEVRFAMNAGMFDEAGRPIGLAISEGRELRAANRREKGGGNFHLPPNGIFLIRKDGRAEVVPTNLFREANDIRVATQSGPMLVIDGAVNPRFDADGNSRYIRNGVGVDEDGVPVFVISETPVSFGRFARLFSEELGCRNALYLDGSVSSLWNPAGNRMDSFAPIGPMLVAFAGAGRQ